TANATTAIATTASQSGVASAVPTLISATPATASATYAPARVASAPVKLTKSSSAKEPNAANVATCALPIACEPIANTVGTTTAARIARRSPNQFGSCARNLRSKDDQCTLLRQSAGTRSAGPGAVCSAG